MGKRVSSGGQIYQSKMPAKQTAAGAFNAVEGPEKDWKGQGTELYYQKDCGGWKIAGCRPVLSNGQTGPEQILAWCLPLQISGG